MSYFFSIILNKKIITDSVGTSINCNILTSTLNKYKGIGIKINNLIFYM